MRSWKSYSIAAVFFVLSSTSLMACDVRQLIEDAVLSIVTGNNQGCAGCIVGCAGSCDCASCDCASCGSCGACGDCAGCEGCDCTVGDIRDRSTGRKEGFNGRGAGAPSAQLLRDRGLHNGRRIVNSVQARLSQSGLMFIQNLVPVVASGLAGRIDLSADLNNGSSPGYITATLENVQFRSEAGCQGNSQNLLATTAGTATPCLRLDANIRYRTCSPAPVGAPVCTNAQQVQVQVDAPVVGTVTCQLTLNSAGAGGANATLPFTARVALMGDSTSTTYNGYSRIKILDAQTSSLPIDRQDVDVACSNLGTINFLLGLNCIGDSSQPCNVNQAVDFAVSDLNGSMNTMIDALLDHYMPALCAPAPTALECPTGTVFQAPAGGSPPGTQGTCLLAPSGAGCPTGTVYHAGDNRCYNVRDGGNVNTAADRWGTACLEIFAGAEMRVDTGSVLGAISPGIESILDLMVAAGGAGEHANNGHNFNVMGGMEAVIAGIRSLPHNPCAPIEHPANDQAACDAISSGLEYEPLQNGAFSGRCIPRVPVIPSVSALRQNTAPVVDGLDGDFEVGVGVSESFVNYAAWRVWDSGLTCINAGSWLDPTLSPSLIAFALLSKPSQPRIFFPLNTDSSSGGSTNNANLRSVALGIRAQTSPVVTFDQADDPCEPGTDTRLEISAALSDLNIDLSMWGDDRYLRVGTVDTDLTAVIALDIGPQAASATAGCKVLADGEVGISISRLDFANAHWLPDAPMLTGSDFRNGANGKLPVQTGFNTIGGIAGGIAAGLIPSLNAQTLVNGIIADLGPTLGLSLPMHIEFHKDSFQLLEQTGSCSGAPYDSGARGVDTCTYSFLGVFVDLANGAPTPLTGLVDTQVQITNVTVPEGREGFDMQGEFGTGQSPTVEIAMSATGPENVEYEYAYKTSYSGWSAWQRSPYAVLSGNALFVQGEQEVFARARVVGDDASEDMTSARATFTIDVTAPMIEVYTQDNGDAQLQALDLISDSLTYRVQEPGDDFGDWTALPASGIANLDIDEGSVIEVRDEEGNVASTSDALQGRPNSANSAACGCTTAGARPSGSPLAMVGIAAMLALIVARRRRTVG